MGNANPFFRQVKDPNKPRKVIAGPTSDLAPFNLIPKSEQNREKTAIPFVSRSR